MLALTAVEDVCRWVFKELRDIAEVKFRFAEEEDACEYVTRLAAELHMFAPAHALKVGVGNRSDGSLTLQGCLRKEGLTCRKSKTEENR